MLVKLDQFPPGMKSTKMRNGELDTAEVWAPHPTPMLEKPKRRPPKMQTTSFLQKTMKTQMVLMPVV